MFNQGITRRSEFDIYVIINQIYFLNNIIMNCKEHHLPELELNSGFVREALSAILHTILL